MKVTKKNWERIRGKIRDSSEASVSARTYAYSKQSSLKGYTDCILWEELGYDEDRVRPTKVSDMTWEEESALDDVIENAQWSLSENISKVINEDIEDVQYVLGGQDEISIEFFLAKESK